MEKEKVTDLNRPLSQYHRHDAVSKRKLYAYAVRNRLYYVPTYGAITGAVIADKNVSGNGTRSLSMGLTKSATAEAETETEPSKTEAETEEVKTEPSKTETETETR